MTALINMLLNMWNKSDTRPATICSILSGFLWSACLAFPGETMARPTYTYMRWAASEEVWMVLFFLMACLQTWRLYARTTRKTAAVEYAIKLCALALWTYVAIACFLSQYPPAAAVSDTLVIAVACWWDFIRWRPCRLCNECVPARCPLNG